MSDTPRSERQGTPLDELDCRLLQSLKVAPRAAFSSLADILEVSVQTVARRYRRMRADGIVKISAGVSAEALGEKTWFVRAKCHPGRSRELADAVSRLDIGWLLFGGAGNEVIFTVRSRTAEDREDVLARCIPSTAQVLNVTFALAMHRFPIGMKADQWGRGVDLDDEQDMSLPDEADPALAQFRVQEDALRDSDWALINCLKADGRASFESLAAAADLTAGVAARRVLWLTRRGIVTFEVDIAPHAIGRSTNAQLWMSVPPAFLDRCGRTIAAAPEVAFSRPSPESRLLSHRCPAPVTRISIGSSRPNSPLSPT